MNPILDLHESLASFTISQVLKQTLIFKVKYQFNLPVLNQLYLFIFLLLVLFLAVGESSKDEISHQVQFRFQFFFTQKVKMKQLGTCWISKKKK